MSPGRGKKRDRECCGEAGLVNGWRSHIKWRPQNETTEKWAGDADSLHFPLPWFWFARSCTCRWMLRTRNEVVSARPLLISPPGFSVIFCCRFSQVNLQHPTKESVSPVRVPPNVGLREVPAAETRTARYGPVTLPTETNHLSPGLYYYDTEPVFTMKFKDYPGTIAPARACENNSFFLLCFKLYSCCLYYAFFNFFPSSLFLYWQNMFRLEQHQC